MKHTLEMSGLDESFKLIVSRIVDFQSSFEAVVAVVPSSGVLFDDKIEESLQKNADDFREIHNEICNAATILQKLTGIHDQETALGILDLLRHESLPNSGVIDSSIEAIEAIKQNFDVGNVLSTGLWYPNVTQCPQTHRLIKEIFVSQMKHNPIFQKQCLNYDVLYRGCTKKLLNFAQSNADSMKELPLIAAKTVRSDAHRPNYVVNFKIYEKLINFMEKASIS